MSMQTSSDLSTPILSRSAGYPLTAKVALVTLHCQFFFCFLFLCNVIKFICLICFLIDLLIFFIHVSTVMHVLSVIGWPLPHRNNPRIPLSDGYADWSRIGYADWSRMDHAAYLLEKCCGDVHNQQQIYLDICVCASKSTSHANI